MEGGHLDEETKVLILGQIAPKHSTRELDEMRETVREIKKQGEVFEVPELAERLVCPVCGNRSQENFTHDARGGDVICLGTDGQGCGTVIEEHHRHEGPAFRKFEGEEDKTHHGPAPNRLYSAQHNMRTSVAATGLKGATAAARLRQTAEQVELGLSNLGRDDGGTRVGYKDQQKKRAFQIIDDAAQNLSLHKQVADRAHELFATIRDDKEKLQRFYLVVAACLAQAADDIQHDDVVFQPQVESRREKLLQYTHKRKRDQRPGKAWFDDLDELG